MNIITVRLFVNLDHAVFFLVVEFCSLLEWLGLSCCGTLWPTLALRVLIDPILEGCGILNCSELSDRGMLLLWPASALATTYTLWVLMNCGLIVVRGLNLVESCGISLSQVN